MTEKKPLIVGMSNPYGDDPKAALWPHPPNCTGWRIWNMLRARRADASHLSYTRAFARVNLLSSEYSKTWDRAAAREAARNMLPLCVGRRVLLLGNCVLDAFAVMNRDLSALQPAGEGLVARVKGSGYSTFMFLPHPSGRCRWYNDPRNVAAASDLLAELYDVSLDRTKEIQT